VRDLDWRFCEEASFIVFSDIREGFSTSFFIAIDQMSAVWQFKKMD